MYQHTIHSTSEIVIINALQPEIATLEDQLRRNKGSPAEAAIKANLLAKLKELNAVLDKKSFKTLK